MDKKTAALLRRLRRDRALTRLIQGIVIAALLFTVVLRYLGCAALPRLPASPAASPGGSVSPSAPVSTASPTSGLTITGAYKGFTVSVGYSF